MKKRSQEAKPDTDERKPGYVRPKLKIYGDLRTLTAAKGGAKVEAGQPKTFSPSGPP